MPVKHCIDGDNINWLCPVNWDEPLNDGLVARYQVFQNQPGWQSGQLLNLVDPLYGIHGTLTNMVPQTSYQGPLGRPGGFGSLLFAGGGTNAVTHARPFENIAAFSVSFWLRPTTTPTAGQDIHGKWDNGGATTQQFSRWLGGVNWFVNNAANSATQNITISDSIVLIGAWTFITLVADGANLIGYANGVEKTSAALAGPYIPAGDTIDWKIAGVIRDSSAPASFDSFAYRSRGLNAADAWALYQEEQTGNPQTINRVRPYTVFDVGGGGGARKVLPGNLKFAVAA